MRRILLALLLLAPVSARAQSYMWNFPSTSSLAPTARWLVQQNGTGPYTYITPQQLLGAGFNASFGTLTTTGAASLTGGGTFGGNWGGTLNLTGALSLGGATIPTGPAGQIQQTLTANLGTSAADNRPNLSSTALSITGSTSNVWENNFFQVELKSGTSNGEINIVHPYFQIDSGATLGGIAETFESSGLNNGTQSGEFTNFLGIWHNGSAGTISNQHVLKCQLTNDNTTAAAVDTWACIDNEPMGGSGSAPTNDYLIRNADPNGLLATLGKIRVGSLAAPTALFQVDGPDTGATFNTMINSSAGTILSIRDNGTIAATGTLEIDGPDSSSGTVPFAVKNSGGSVLMAITDAALTTVNTSFVVNGTTNLVGPDNTGSFFPLTVKNHSGTVEFSVSDGGATNVNGTLYLSNPMVYASSSTGSSTPSFTNSPCTGGSVRWIPVQITGQTGNWYEPVCQ